MGEVRLWELRSRELISHLKEHKQKITSLVLFEDDAMAFSASRDRCILRWDLKTEVL
jgi:WD40 repeat protein